MKKYFTNRYFTAILFLAALIIYSCKKDQHRDLSAAPDRTAAFIKEWLAKQPNQIDVHKITNIVNWESAITIVGDSNKHFAVVKLADTSKQIFENNKTVTRFLVIKLQKDTAACLIDLFGSKNDLIDNKYFLLSHFSYNQLKDFTGNQTKYSLKGSFLESAEYIGGHLTQRAIVLPKKTKNNKEILSNEKKVTNTCIDWFLYTYLNGSLISEQYLGTTCSCEAQMTSIRNAKGQLSVKKMAEVCGDGSSGGSGAPTFGANNSNAVISDANFDAFLDYVQNQLHLNVSNPFNTILTVDGKEYLGQVTEIRDPLNNSIIASYFNPDASSDIFTYGQNYNIGNNTNTAANEPMTYTQYFGWPTGDVGNGTATYIPANGGNGNLLVLDTTGLSKYPRLKEVVTKLPRFLMQYPNVLAALAYYTGFTQTKVMQMMQPGVGPKVVVAPNLSDSYGYPIYGHYDAINHTLELRESFALGLQAANWNTTIQATALLLAISTLHEFVHYGRDANHLKYDYIDSVGNNHEAGWEFEHNISGNNSPGITLGNAISWVTFYPYNW